MRRDRALLVSLALLALLASSAACSGSYGQAAKPFSATYERSLEGCGAAPASNKPPAPLDPAGRPALAENARLMAHSTRCLDATVRYVRHTCLARAEALETSTAETRRLRTALHLGSISTVAVGASLAASSGGVPLVKTAMYPDLAQRQSAWALDVAQVTLLATGATLAATGGAVALFGVVWAPSDAELDRDRSRMELAAFAEQRLSARHGAWRQCLAAASLESLAVAVRHARDALERVVIAQRKHEVADRSAAVLARTHQRVADAKAVLGSDQPPPSAAQLGVELEEAVRAGRDAVALVGDADQRRGMRDRVEDAAAQIARATDTLQTSQDRAGALELAEEGMTRLQSAVDGAALALSSDLAEAERRGQRHLRTVARTLEGLRDDDVALPSATPPRSAAPGDDDPADQLADLELLATQLPTTQQNDHACTRDYDELVHALEQASASCAAPSGAQPAPAQSVGAQSLPGHPPVTRGSSDARAADTKAGVADTNGVGEQ